MSDEAYLDYSRDPNAETGSRAARFAGGGDEPESAPRVADRGRAVGSVVASRYTLTARLGHSRLGEAYEAVDRSLSDRELGLEHRVALYLLHRHVAQQTRFLRKLEASYQQPHLWAHANVVKVRGFGCDRGQYFLVTELIEGVTLRALLDDMKGTLPSAAEAFAVLRGVGDALEYAHAKGAVHGDIRPETIFVTGDWAIKVPDLLPACSLRTVPFFLEDVASDALATPDPRDDVYGLACVAYELLSGSHPFGGRSPREASIAGLAPAPNPRIAARQLDALLRALALRRDQRTVSVAAFLEEFGVTGRETLHALRETTQSAVPSDLPIIGDHSAEVATPDIGTGLPQWVEYQRVATRATEAPWRIDPADVQRHAHLKTVNESRNTGFGIWVVLVAALGVAVYWNYEGLRGFIGNLVAKADSLSAAFAQNGAPASSIATSKVAEVEAPRAFTHEPAELQQPPPVVARPVAATSASGPAAPEKTAAVAAAETFAFATSVVTVSEARAGASVLIQRRGGTPGESSPGESSIVWWTSDGSALASDDYADLGTVVEKFAAGEENRTISIPIVGDAKSEGRESFYVHLATREAPGNLAQSARRIEVFVDDDD
jgi:serine/threonine protein kinase